MDAPRQTSGVKYQESEHDGDRHGFRHRAGIAAPPEVHLDALRGAFTRFCRAMRLRHGRRQLQQLPDRLLKDIGIGRSEIDSIVEGVIDNPRGDPRRPSRILAQILQNQRPFEE